MGKELAVIQQLDVQVETSDEWCPSGVCILPNIPVGDMDSGIGCTPSSLVDGTMLCDVIDMLEEGIMFRGTLTSLRSEPHEVQQGQIQGLVSGSGQSQI